MTLPLLLLYFVSAAALSIAAVANFFLRGPDSAKVMKILAWTMASSAVLLAIFFVPALLLPSGGWRELIEIFAQERQGITLLLIGVISPQVFWFRPMRHPVPAAVISLASGSGLLLGVGVVGAGC